MACDKLTEYTGTLPADAVGDEAKMEACNTFMEWVTNKFTKELNADMPSICEAAAAGGYINFKGDYDTAKTYKDGDTVLKDGKRYRSLEDNNMDTPPSAKWVSFVFTINGLEYDGTAKDRDKIIPRWSETAGLAPTATDLDARELAINLTDKKIFSKDSNGNIVVLNGVDYNLAGERIEDYHELTLVNQWTGSLKFTKFANGWVQVIGDPENSGGDSSYHHIQISTLPAGYRPAVEQYIASPSSRWGYTCWCNITTDGVIACDVVGDYKQFINFIYRAEN